MKHNDSEVHNTVSTTAMITRSLTEAILEQGISTIKAGLQQMIILIIGYLMIITMINWVLTDYYD